MVPFQYCVRENPMPVIDHEMFSRAVAAERRQQWRARLFAAMVCTVFLLPVAWAVAGQVFGYHGRDRVLMTPVLSLVGVATLGGFLIVVPTLIARLFMSFLQPGGRARGPKGHSKAEALAASGLVDEASAEFERLRGTLGDSVASLRVEAELHARPGGDALRAASLFQRIRQAGDATLNDELYASHRLIDLYVGPLEDQGRVMVELRRMAERFPHTPDGQGALAELRRRRSEAA
jgi:hypothetical protein